MKKLWTIIISIVIVAALGFGAWAFWMNSDKTNQSSSKDAKPLYIYYVSKDSKRAGDPIGCGDSIVSNDSAPVTAKDRVKSAFERLLANKNQFVGQSKLYNALYQSNLKFESSETKGDALVVELSGELKLGGECDDRRVKAQLEYTAKNNADTLPVVVIMLNNKPLNSALSQK